MRHRAKILITASIVIVSVVGLIRWWPAPISWAQGGDPQPVYEIRVYASYQFNTLKRPTGLVGLNLRGQGFQLFIADSGNHVIRQFSPGSGTLTTIAGQLGTPGYVDGDPMSALFSYPTGITGRNYTYMQCEYDYYSANGAPQVGTMALPAVQTDPLPRGATPPDTSAVEPHIAPPDLSSLPLPDPLPLGYACCRTCFYFNYQTIRINDSLNYVVRRLLTGDVREPEVPQVTTEIGANSNAPNGNPKSSSAAYADGENSTVGFSALAGITDDATSTFYIVDAGNNAIRKWDGSNVSTLAGDGEPGFVDGYREGARFNAPGKTTQDDAGNIYVADIENHAIRKIDVAGNVTTLAGNGHPGEVDGQGWGAYFFRPTSLVFNPADGMLYVADSHNNVIRRVDMYGNTAVYAGTGEAGLVNGPLGQAQFSLPTDLIIKNGFMYVSDTANNVIRMIDMANGNVYTYIS